MENTIKEIQSLFECWHHLKVFRDMEVFVASLCLDNKIIFQNLPLEIGTKIIPAISFTLDVENPIPVEIDDFSIQIGTFVNESPAARGAHL
ncbi:MAG: hypothetical protein MUF15_05060 [Acidobacteria bacterium]|nr:hypothetical protein [Acidobacteriota bacterium]